MESIESIRYRQRNFNQPSQQVGELEDGTSFLNNPKKLNELLAKNGYLLLRNFHKRDDVIATRNEVYQFLAKEGCLAPGSKIEDGIANPDKDHSHYGFLPSNLYRFKNLRNVVFSKLVQNFWESLFGEPSAHFDFIWFRAVNPGDIPTTPHMDSVYMNRGTQRLFTMWTPYCDIPYDMGGLGILENSHLNKKVIETYGSWDVDASCTAPPKVAREGTYKIPPKVWPVSEERAYGAYHNDLFKVQKDMSGRWLTTEYNIGDVLFFSISTMHAAFDNRTNLIRLSSDTRYQRKSESIDKRWIGENPIGHGEKSHKKLIC